MALVGKVGVSLRCQPHGDVRAEPRRRYDELGRGRHSGTHCEIDALQRESPALPVFRHAQARSQGDPVRQGDYSPHAVHLELQPEERRPADRTAAAAIEFPLSVVFTCRH